MNLGHGVLTGAVGIHGLARPTFSLLPIGEGGLERHTSRQGIRDGADMPMISLAAPAQLGVLEHQVAQLAIPLGQVCWVAGVQRCGVVQLGMAQGGRVGSDAPDALRPAGSVPQRMREVTGWTQVIMK